MTKAIDVRYCDIPEYLRNGEFFRSLNDDDPEESIKIPEDYFAETTDVETQEQFARHLKAISYWMLDEIPTGVVKYCIQNHYTSWRDVVFSLPEDEQLSFVKGLLSTLVEEEGIRFCELHGIRDWDIIEHIMELCCDKTNDKSTIKAAEAGHCVALKSFHERGFPWNKDTCLAASENGHIECLQFAHKSGCPWDIDVYRAAARNGHLHIIRYAHEQGLQWQTIVCNDAAYYGHLDCLQYAHENGCPWDVKVYIHAVVLGHLHCIQYAHQQGLEWTAEVCKEAALHGQLICLQYALEHGCRADNMAHCAAVQNGHLDSLQLLHQYHVPWDETTCIVAAMRSDVTYLQYLHENGCTWDDQTTSTASRFGNLDPLQYAFHNGCEHFEHLMFVAACSGSIDCIQYLLEEQGLYMDQNGNVFLASLLKGNLQCLQYLLDQGCPYHDAQFTADDAATAAYDTLFTKNNPEFVQCLQFAVERGWCMDQNCIDYLVSRDWDNCREYLTQEGYMTSVSKVIQFTSKLEAAAVKPVVSVENKDAIYSFHINITGFVVSHVVMLVVYVVALR